MCSSLSGRTDDVVEPTSVAGGPHPPELPVANPPRRDRPKRTATVCSVTGRTRGRVDPIRRRLVVGLAAAPLLGLGLSACSIGHPAKSAPAELPDADSRLRWAALRGEQSLLSLHAAVVAKHPGLAASLEPLTAHHTEHVAAITAEGPLPIAAGGVPEPSAAAVPDDAGSALAAVRDAERVAADARLTGCLQAAGPRLAGLLASVGAAEAAHDAALAAA